MENKYVIKFAKFEIKKSNENSDYLKIQGFASVHSVLDCDNDVILKNAFSESLKAHKENGTMPHMLLEHNKSVSGFWTKIQEHPYGLWVEGQISKREVKVCEAIDHHKLNELSIGFFIKESQVEQKIIDGHKVQVRYIKTLHLVEISLVNRAANKYASFFKNDEIEFFGSSLNR